MADPIEDIDSEVAALGEMAKALVDFDRTTQRRMLEYLVDRFVTRPVRGDAPEERERPESGAGGRDGG